MTLPTSPRSRLRTIARVTALVAVLGMLSTACRASGYAWVSSSDHKAYFKVPAGWHFFDKRDILVATGQSLSAASNQQLPWLIGFDADPHPSVKHIIGLPDALKYPAVMARVERLPDQVRDQFSLASMRNAVYPVDRLLQANAAEVIRYKDVDLPGGFHGSQIIFDVVLNGVAGVMTGNEVIRVAQTAVVDPKTKYVYLFMVRCESHCFRDYGNIINQIDQSWTVKER